MNKLKCPKEGCDYESDTNRGLSIHASSKHPDLEYDFTNKKEYTCKFCGDNFKDYATRRESKGEKNNFCSKECKDSFEGKDGLDTECSECGNEIHIPPSQIEEVGGYEQNNYFCDKECESLFKSENWVNDKHPSWDGGKVSIECEECGDTYKVKDCEKDKSKYCSRECTIEGFNIEKKEYSCENCGKTVLKKPYNVSGYVVCSEECMKNQLSEIRKGKQNPQWKGGRFRYYGQNWQEQREKALERDNYTCQKCGLIRNKHYKKYEEDLHVHHKKPRREFIEDKFSIEKLEKANQLNNLITLCKSCHRKIE